jgi:hypothetical protein
VLGIYVLLKQERKHSCKWERHEKFSPSTSSLKAKERLATRQAIVVADFDVRAMWLCHESAGTERWADKSGADADANFLARGGKEEHAWPKARRPEGALPSSLP